MMKLSQIFTLILIISSLSFLWTICIIGQVGKRMNSFIKDLRFSRKISSGNRIFNSRSCHNYRQRERLNPTYFYLYNNTNLHHHHKSLLWCKVPKAASTTLTKFYLRLANVSTDQTKIDSNSIFRKNITKVHKILRSYYQKPSLHLLKNLSDSKSVIKFMIVRDPFERLVSAYRDKLADYKRDLRYRDGFYFKSYGKFMRLGNFSNNSSTHYNRAPTWSEFVQYLIKTSVGRYDEHWMPISRLCSPCALNYDYIIKLERFQKEVQHPLKRVGISSPNLGWSHSTGTKDWIINRYFNNLTLNQIKKLYVKYKRDFQLFGYKPYRYFKLAQN